jgi:myo-inositol 2-dehydrogenase/D-chiro-inositol 1-dehydrogenase/scyllo-inositol 2-dehydrogenase (NAD+)
MKPLKVCLIGAGRVGSFIGHIYNEYITKARITAIVDTDFSTASLLVKNNDLPKNSVFTDFEQAILKQKFDAVLVTTPTFTHKDLTKIAANKKLNVFCEKPMAITIEDCDEMIEACEKNNVILQIGFMRRFNKDFQAAKSHIDEGLIGEPIIIKSLTRGPGLAPKWSYDIKNSNGILAEVNSHDFDTVRWLANSEYTKVYAEAHNFKSQEILKEYPQFYDSAIVNLRLKNNTMATIDVVCPCDYGYDSRTEVVGTKGVIFIGSLKGNTLSYCTKDNSIVTPQFLSWKNRFQEGYINEHKYFINCIIKGEKPVVAGYDGKMATCAVIAANSSIISGKAVNL